jgi:RNA polymerase sigma-70 factor (ECF subfamily)
MDRSIETEMLRAVPHLRAFAVSLTANIEKADDLVQETLVRGLTHIDRFEAGTNMGAWLTTILRNQFYTMHRKRRWEAEDPDGLLSAKFAVVPRQGAKLDFEDMLAALAKLSPRQREAVLLIGAEGYSYEEAARICNTSIGTIKSRVNRARTRLAEMLGFNRAEGFARDALMPSVTYAGLAA